MDNCIFCKILSGRVGCRKIYEDDLILAFLDIARDADGHILIIPKEHICTLTDCSPAMAAALMQTAQKISRHLMEACGYEGVNLLHASGQAAGQSVPHFHLHLIPRRSGDNLDCWPKLPGAQSDLDDICQKITMISRK